MALIPPDAGIRMRMQTEANQLQPVHPVHEIPSDLPDLRPGQTFNARIQEVLPDNTYRALVAGRQLTLQLPESAEAGDQLELVVIDRSPKAIIARRTEDDAASADTGRTAPYPFAKFSPAARLIGQLLPAEGEAPAPAQLNRGQPLLPQPPQPQAAAVQLAPMLAKAVTQSGLFYEAHQAQWVAGRLPLEQLLQEPQGQKSAPTAFQQAAAETDARATATPERPVIAQAVQANGEKLGAGGVAQNAAPNTAPSAPQPPGLTQPLPDDLRPLVQQQLDAAGTQRLFWHGEVWPRQSLDWEIEWENERAADSGEEESLRWRTALALTTPRLGRVEASLQLTTQGVSITLAAAEGASATDLRDAAPQLAAALAAAGVPLRDFQVRHAAGTEAAA